LTFAADTAAIFDGPLAVDATYTPDGGSAVAVRIIPSQPDVDLTFGDTRLGSTSSVFKLPVSQIANPVAGDVIVKGGDTFTIQGKPRRNDRRLVWTIEARLT
jgi:hypothetical protein